MTTLAARNQLVEENLSLATVLAKRAKLRFPPSIELDDLIQEARIGLMAAASKWDPESPVYFRVYAWRRVWGAMIDAHRRRHWVNDTHEELPADYKTGNRGFLNDDRGVRASNGDTNAKRPLVAADPHPDVAIDCKRRKRVLAEVIEMLPARSRDIVVDYYRSEMKNREIGARVGLGENRVGQIHRGALVEMRRGLVARGIRKAA